jgi:hypothetical protein
MNAAPSNGNSTFRLVGALIVLLVAAVLLYYLYDYLFNVTQVQKKADLVGGPIPSPSGSGIITYPGSGQTGINLSQYVFTGGEMSLSFWMYVTGIQRSTLTKAHILHLGDDENSTNPTLLITLGPANSNGLYVRVNDGTDASFSLPVYMGQSGDTDTSKVCNISNIEFGRWVNVTTVLNNNLCDVYMDGKLSRSCVLKGQFQVGSDATKPLKFFVLKPKFDTTDTTWKGSLAGVSFYNYAVSPDIVYRIYMAGPSGASGDLWTAIKSFFVPAGNAIAPFLA